MSLDFSGLKYRGRLGYYGGLFYFFFYIYVIEYNLFFWLNKFRAKIICNKIIREKDHLKGLKSANNVLMGLPVVFPAGPQRPLAAPPGTPPGGGGAAPSVL